LVRAPRDAAVRGLVSPDLAPLLQRRRRDRPAPRAARTRPRPEPPLPRRALAAGDDRALGPRRAHRVALVARAGGAAAPGPVGAAGLERRLARECPAVAHAGGHRGGARLARRGGAAGPRPAGAGGLAGGGRACAG